MGTTEKLKIAIEKELKAIGNAESKLRKKAQKPVVSYREKLEEKIPKRIKSALESSFSKAFGIVFENGVGIIEKGYNKNNIAADYDVQNYAIEKKGSRREIRRLKRSAMKSELVNVSITAVEGIGLGVLGIGLPDVVIFVGMILKGIYEVSLRYGYDYNVPQEKRFILSMMKAALSNGEEWCRFNDEVDRMLCCGISEGDLKIEIDETSRVFATDLLLMKFIQGIPVVGAFGGFFNPVYYNKIMKYVRIKYHKRYLLDKVRCC